MSDERPAPLVPAEVDLRDFGFMPLEVVRLRDSELAVDAPPEVFRASVLLWAASWHQVPAGSLPAKDSLLADLAKSVKGWSRIRGAVLAEWITCSDGRLYHPVVAEKARESWEAKQARKARTEKATAARAANRDGSTNVSRDAKRDDSHDDQRDVARDVHQGKGEQGKGEKKGKAPTAPALTVDELVADGLRPETAAEFLAQRRRKRAPLTATAWDGIKEEAAKARFTIQGAIAKALMRGWTSFEAEWVKDDRTKRADLASATVPPAETVEENRRRLEERDRMTPDEKARADKAAKLALSAIRNITPKAAA